MARHLARGILRVDLASLLTLAYWFNGTSPPPTPFTFVVMFLFAAALIASVIVWLRRRRIFPGQRIKTRLAHQLGPWFTTFSLIGLISTILRAVQFPILGARIIWAVSGLVIVGLAAYVARYMRTRYAPELARLERQEALQRFIPKPRSKRRR
jgi:hypothetical protein